MDATNNEKADVLKWMLGQIYRAEKRKKQLDERLVRIAEERDAPIGGVGYRPLPRSSSGEGNGAASIILKMSDIEERIYTQKEEVEKAIVRVMDILDYLRIATHRHETVEGYSGEHPDVTEPVQQEI